LGLAPTTTILHESQFPEKISEVTATSRPTHCVVVNNISFCLSEHLNVARVCEFCILYSNTYCSQLHIINKINFLYDEKSNYIADIYNIKVICMENTSNIKSNDIKTESKIVERNVFSYILFFIAILILEIYLDYNKIVSKNRIFEYIYKKI
jgi:hypothetical protein